MSATLAPSFDLYAVELLWLPLTDISSLGVPGPSGNENDLYVSDDVVFKVNNLLNCGSVLRFLDRLTWHNEPFCETRYSLFGHAGFEGRTVMPVVKQQLIKNARLLTTNHQLEFRRPFRLPTILNS